jgi:hypothetical protein
VEEIDSHGGDIGGACTGPLFYGIKCNMSKSVFEPSNDELPNYCLEKEFPLFKKNVRDMFPLITVCPNCKHSVYKYNRKKSCNLNQESDNDI